MPNEVVVAIAHLVEQTATRARAKEAYCRLVNHLSSMATRPALVVLDFSNERVVTGSFLDEFVLRISELPTGVKLAFRLPRNEDVEKLEKVCAVRRVTCLYQIGECGDMRRTKTNRLPRIEAQEYNGAFFTA